MHTPSSCLKKYLAFSLCSCLAMSASLAWAETSLVLQGESNLRPDKQYFQNIAHSYIPGQAAAGESSAVLQGSIEYLSRQYYLGPGDSLKLLIPGLSLEEVSRDVSAQDFNGQGIKEMVLTVDSNGNITVPPFGTFYVTGMSLEKLTVMLEKMTHYYLVNPKVYLSLKTPKPASIYVLGEVKHPGSYQALNNPGELSENGGKNLNAVMSEEQFYQQQFYLPRVSMVLAKAGGLLPSADVSHITVTNPTSGKKIQIDLQALLQGDTSQDILLEASDVVHIPKSEELLPASVASSNFGPQTYTVRVVGYTLGGAARVTLDPSHMNIMSAIGQTQIDPKADLKKVIVLRYNSQNSGVEQVKVNALADNFKLKPDDVVYIPHNRPVYQLQQALTLAAQMFVGAGIFSNGVLRDSDPVVAK